jgi:hypothetical protein
MFIDHASYPPTLPFLLSLSCLLLLTTHFPHFSPANPFLSFSPLFQSQIFPLQTHIFPLSSPLLSSYDPSSLPPFCHSGFLFHFFTPFSFHRAIPSSILSYQSYHLVPDLSPSNLQYMFPLSSPLLSSDDPPPHRFFFLVSSFSSINAFFLLPISILSILSFGSRSFPSPNRYIEYSPSIIPPSGE